MIVCHARKFIFVAPPKTGGGKAQPILAKLCEPHDTFHVANPPARLGKSWSGPVVDLNGTFTYLRNHRSLSTVFDVFGERVADYKIIASERNPFDRLLARYLFQTARASNLKNPKVIDQRVIAGLLEGMPSRDHFEQYVISAADGYADACDYYSLSGVDVADFIVRHEHVAEDMKQLAIFLDCDPGILEVDPAPSKVSWRDLGTRDPEFQKYFYENVERHVRKRFQRTFDVMGYGGPGTDCPPFIPYGHRHQVREAYLGRATAGHLSRPTLNRARFKFPGAVALLRHLHYRRHRGRV